MGLLKSAGIRSSSRPSASDLYATLTARVDGAAAATRSVQTSRMPKKAPVEFLGRATAPTPQAAYSQPGYSGASANVNMKEERIDPSNIVCTAIAISFEQGGDLLQAAPVRKRRPPASQATSRYERPPSHRQQAEQTQSKVAGDACVHVPALNKTKEGHETRKRSSFHRFRHYCAGW